MEIADILDEIIERMQYLDGLHLSNQAQNVLKECIAVVEEAKRENQNWQ